MSQQLDLFNDTPFTLRVTIEDAMRIFVDNYWRHLPFGKKSKSYIQKLLFFFRGHYLDTISKADVERLRRHLKEVGYSDSTINKVHMILSRLYTKWKEYKDGRFLNGADLSRVVLPQDNPAGEVPRVNEKQYARDFEITKERKQILCKFADPDLAEIIDTLFWSMLRQGDLFAITDKNVNLELGTITGIQNKTITTRNPSGLPYKVMIPRERIAMIRRRIENSKPGTPIFKKSNLQKRWALTRRLASEIDPKLTKAQMRDIRGGATSHLLDNGSDIETVRKKGGWASLEMIPTYDKRGEPPLQEASETLVKI